MLRGQALRILMTISWLSRLHPQLVSRLGLAKLDEVIYESFTIAPVPKNNRLTSDSHQKVVQLFQMRALAKSLLRTHSKKFPAFWIKRFEIQTLVD
jgi:hypothetical protein